MKVKSALLNNIGLKMLALILAFVTWLYIGEVIEVDSEMTVLQKLLSSSDYISKKLYVKPIFVGAAPAGYKFTESEVKVTPESIVVLGPSNVLSGKEFIYTEPIDLSEHTKRKRLDVELADISPSMKFQKADVQVYLPVEKIEN